MSWCVSSGAMENNFRFDFKLEKYLMDSVIWFRININLSNIFLKLYSYLLIYLIVKEISISILCLIADILKGPIPNSDCSNT